jgi:hypothetical protein
MKTYKAVAFLTGLIALSFSSPRGLAATQLPGRKVTPDPEALAVASRWLATVDAGNYKTARHMMAARIRRAGKPVDQRWLEWARERHAPLGRAVSRSVSEARFSNTWPGTPDGMYEYLIFKTVFARKAQATEYMILTKESGHWEVSGYGFRQPMICLTTRAIRLTNR